MVLRLLSFDKTLHGLHGFNLLELCNLVDYDKLLRIGGAASLYLLGFLLGKLAL